MATSYVGNRPYLNHSPKAPPDNPYWFRPCLFATLGIPGFILFFRPLRELSLLSFQNQLYSHVLLIPAVSLCFLWINRSSIFSSPNYGYRWGITLLVIAVVLSLLSKHVYEWNRNDRLSMLTFGALVWFSGSFITSYGANSFRKGIFPFLFLIFMVPVPTLLLDPLIGFLRSGSAHIAYGIFKALGVPVFRQGFVFSLPGIDIEVAKQCSGIRSTIALVITSVLAGHLFLRTAKGRLLFVLCVFPITIFKNAIRILTISLLAVYVDKTFLTNSWLHKSGGIVFFVLALGLLAPILWLLKREEDKQ